MTVKVYHNNKTDSNRTRIFKSGTYKGLKHISEDYKIINSEKVVIDLYNQEKVEFVVNRGSSDDVTSIIITNKV